MTGAKHSVGPSYFSGPKVARARKKKKMEPVQFCIAMQNLGFKTTERQLWRWENEETTPTADGLIAICLVLGIKNVREVTR